MTTTTRTTTSNSDRHVFSAIATAENVGASTDCGICLTPQPHHHDDENDENKTTIELSCMPQEEQPAYTQLNNQCNDPALFCDVSQMCLNNSLSEETCSSKESSFDALPSRNLLVNPSGKQGMKGWRSLNDMESWQTEASALRLSKDVATNFVSTHFWCSMEQTVDVWSALSAAMSSSSSDLSTHWIEVSAMYMGHLECPSVFRMQAELLDASGRCIQKSSTRILKAASDSWEQAMLVLEPTATAHSVKTTLHGKDGLLWRGHYGSKVTDCSVRVMGGELAQ